MTEETKELAKHIPEEAFSLIQRRNKENPYYRLRGKINGGGIKKRKGKKRGRKPVLKHVQIEFPADYNFLSRFHIVKEGFIKKFGVTQRELEVLFMLYSMTIFTNDDYTDMFLIGSKPRLKTLEERGIIQKLETRIKRRVKIYELTPIYKTRITDFYDSLLDDTKKIAISTQKAILKKKRGATRKDILTKLEKFNGLI